MKLNGDIVESFEGSLRDFLSLHTLQRPGIAVAVDGEVIPRSLWSSTILHGDALIEVVTAAAGG